MKLDELYQNPEKNLDEYVTGTLRGLNDNIKMRVRWAIQDAVNDKKVYKLARSAESRGQWGNALSFVSKLKPYLDKKVQPDDINKAKEYIFHLISQKQITKIIDEFREQLKAKKGIQKRAVKKPEEKDSFLKKAYKFAKDQSSKLSSPHDTQPVLSSMYAEGKRAGGARAWQIQWALKEDGTESNNPKYIFAKNQSEAMKKFLERFNNERFGLVQIESVKEVDWNVINEEKEDRWQLIANGKQVGTWPSSEFENAVKTYRAILGRNPETRLIFVDLDSGLEIDPMENPDLIEDKDPCWKNYKQIGFKKKNGKRVPNCVPKESVKETVADDDWYDYSTEELRQRVESGEHWMDVVNSLAREYASTHGNDYDAFDFAADALGRRAWEMGLKNDDDEQDYRDINRMNIDYEEN